MLGGKIKKSPILELNAASFVFSSEEFPRRGKLRLQQDFFLGGRRGGGIKSGTKMFHSRRPAGGGRERVKEMLSCPIVARSGNLDAGPSNLFSFDKGEAPPPRLFFLGHERDSSRFEIICG